MKKIVIGLALVALAAIGLFIPVGGGAAEERTPPRPRSGAGKKPSPFDDLPADPPKWPLRLVFLHHSVGGRLLADPGPKQRLDEEIWAAHPEGGGLRRMLQSAGYEVREASYGSAVGDKTDLGDWLPKFRDQMDRVLAVEGNDRALPDWKKNQIVVFKSCFPNNMLEDDDAVSEAKAKLSALLPLFAAQPDVLFVFMTSPPLAPRVESQAACKALARRLLGKPQPQARLTASGPRARALADWVTSPDGWLHGYAGKNVAAFDLYDVLTDGRSDFLAFPTGDGTDSHPTRAGNAKAAAAFVPLLNRAARRARLTP